MAENTCHARCCQAARLRVRQALENTPMNRVSAPAQAAGETSCACPCRAAQIAALLEEQTQLLYDILGAVNSLTAAQLAAGQPSGGAVR